MMVIYVPVKFEFDWTNGFRVTVRKRKCGRTDGWTDKRNKTDGQMDGQTNGQKTDKQTDGITPISKGT